MKTIQKWFESFPDPDIRARLLANLEQQPAARDMNVGSFREALGAGFHWRLSTESRNTPRDGDEFWNTIYESINGDLPATAAEYCADLRERIVKYQPLYFNMQTLLRKIQKDFGWMADLNNAGTRIIDEAQIRRTLLHVEDFLQRMKDFLPQ